MLQRLLHICKNVVNVLEADGQSDEIRCHPRGQLLFGRKLLVGGRRRVDSQRLGVSQVRYMGNQLEGIDKFLAGVQSSLDTEPDQRPGSPREVFGGLFFFRACREPRIVNPGDPGVFFQVLRDGQRIVAMARHPQVKRFETLQE